MNKETKSRYDHCKQWLSKKLKEDISDTDMLYDVENYFADHGLEPDYILDALIDLKVTR